MKALIVTGEASGDLYGGQLTTALKARLPSLQVAGMGGPHMEEAGVHLLYPYGHVAVVGVFEVLGKLQHLRAAFKNIREWVDANQPDFAVLIDFPDFNFRVAKFLKSRGIKIFYFISPQLWAWRKGRIHFLRDHVDLMICILPFEKEIYSAAGVPVEYAGHPLVEIVRSTVQNQTPRAKTSGLRIGIMPGSRDVEMQRHLSILQESARKIRQQSGAEVLLMWPPSLDATKYDVSTEFEVVTQERYAAMQSCDLMLVASGTSTLECAILGVPLLIVYRVAPVSWLIGKALVRVPYYGLVNWIAGKKVIPEFIQSDMDADLLAAKAMEYLKDPLALEKMRADLSGIVSQLGPEGAMDRAGDAIVRSIQKQRGAPDSSG